MDPTALPAISQLPLKRDVGEVYLKDQSLKLPATYLGGQPLICRAPPHTTPARMALLPERREAV
jgi:hypothetical protein